MQGLGGNRAGYLFLAAAVTSLLLLTGFGIAGAAAGVGLGGAFSAAAGGIGAGITGAASGSSAAALIGGTIVTLLSFATLGGVYSFFKSKEHPEDAIHRNLKDAKRSVEKQHGKAQNLVDNHKRLADYHTARHSIATEIHKNTIAAAQDVSGLADKWSPKLSAHAEVTKEAARTAVKKYSYDPVLRGYVAAIEGQQGAVKFANDSASKFQQGLAGSMQNGASKLSR